MGSNREAAVVTGLGVVSSIGSDIASFTAALRAGRSGITRLPVAEAARYSVPVAARLDGLDWKAALGRWAASAPGPVTRATRLLRNAPESARWTTLAALEAWTAAGLDTDQVSPERIGLIVGGNNLHQSFGFQAAGQFASEPDYPNARYGICFFDTFQVGAISEVLGIRGPGNTVGAASASGNAALIEALQWLRAGRVDICVVCGAGGELSPPEMRGLALIGAAYCAEGDRDPATVSRPFDAARAGFIYGQGSACLVLETAVSVARRGAAKVGELAGGASCLDANHLPDPAVEGEVRAMTGALADAGVAPEEVGYLNAHGTGSTLGDETECAAIRQVFGAHAAKLRVNSTKPLTGHCLQSAGAIEAVATLIQLNGRFAHANLNLHQPIDPGIGFLGRESEPLDVTNALSNSFGFGGINSSILLRRGT